jgi:hypothetical protein
MTRGGREGGEDRPAAGGSSIIAIGWLAVCAAVSVAAGFQLAVVEHARVDVALWLLSSGMAFAMLLLLTRRTRVAAAAVLAALGGTATGAILPALAGAPPGVPVTAFALGIAMSAYLADAFIEEILADRPRRNAAEHARRRIFPAALCATIAAVALPLAGLFNQGESARLMVLSVAIEFAITLLFVILALPSMLCLWTYSEAFIAEANRRRERRARRAYLVSMVAVPRWGMSVSGIALVFAVLASFSAGPSLAASESGEFFIVQVLTLLLIALLAGSWLTVAWRETAALVLSALYLQLLVVALAVRTPGGGLTLPSGAFAAIPISVLSLLAVAGRARTLRAAGDEPSVARLKSIEEALNPVLYATAAAIAALLLWPFVDIATLLLLVLGALLAVVVAPAFATAIETLLPRQRSVEELYTRR